MKYIISLVIILSGIGILSGQCYPDRHNTTWFHAWTSCDLADNPNSSRGKSHWILYDFGHIYKLENMHVWNLNDPSNLKDGLKNVVIDYSLDGNTWNEYGSTEFQIATGKSIYEGEDLLNFNGLTTRYLLITAIDNWGGECYGFSELRIGVAPITATELVNFDLDCNDKNDYTELEWTLTNESKTVSFDVEKSLDGNHWSTINSTGNIAVKEGSNVYKYNDKSSNEAYYRIKIIERDGKYAYSDSHFCSKSNIRLKAFPNPFVKNFEVELLAQNDDPIIYTLTDIYGRTLDKGIITPNSTINYLNFKNLDFLAGHYYLTVRQGGKTGQLKLVKVNSYGE